MSQLEESDIIARMRKLFELWANFDQVYNKFLRRWNLSYNAYLVLEVLYYSKEALEPAELADKQSIPRQTMTFVLDSLEKGGYVERLPHPKDRRKKNIALTAAGQTLAEDVVETMFEKEVEAMEVLTTEEQEVLLNIYLRLHKGFEKSMGKMPD